MPLSDEDIGLAKPAALSGGLSDADLGLGPVSAPVDIAKALPTYAVKGLAHIPGFPGEVAKLGESVSGWLGDKFGPTIPEGVPQIGRDNPADPRFAQYYVEHPIRQTVDALAYGISPARVMPTGQDISNAILGVTGKYEPQTTPGKIASEGVEFGTSMLGPGGALRDAGGLARKAGQTFAEIPTRLRDVGMGFSAGLGSGVAGELSKNPAGEESGLAKFGGAIMGGSIPTALQKLGTAVKPLLGGKYAQDSAEKAAGSVLKTSATDADAAQAALDAYAPTRVSLSTSQAASDPGLEAASERFRNLAGRQDNSGELTAPRTAREEANVRALMDQAERLGGSGSPLAMEQFHRTASEQADEAVKSAFDDLSTKMTRGEASASAREAFDKALAAEKKATDKLWSDPRLADTPVKRDVFFDEIQKYGEGLDPITLRQIPADVRDALREYAEKYSTSATIPLEAAQKIRSQVLELSRDAASGANPNKAQARALGGLASKILDIIEGPAAIALKDKGAVAAWKQARDATRQFHERFTAGVLGKFDDVDTSGVRRVADEATLGQIIGKSGSGSEQKLEQFLKAAGPDAEKPVTEYMMNILYGNGAKEPTAKQIEKFASDYSHVLYNVPGLDDKIHALYDATLAREGVRGSQSAAFTTKSPENAVMSIFRAADPQAAATQLMGQLTKAGDSAAIEGLRRNTVDTMLQQAKSPQDILKFMDKYEKPLGRILNEPHQQDLMKALRDNIESVGKAPSGPVGSMSGIKSLEGGRFIDLLLGNVGGKVAGAGLGVGAAKLLETAVPGAGAAGMLVELLGAAGGLKYGEKALSAGPYARTQEQTLKILSKAFEDPKLAATLMKKATPANWKRLEQSAAPALTAIQASQTETGDR